MKKIAILIVLPLLLYGANFSNKMGFQFGISQSPVIGFKYHLNDVFALSASMRLELDQDTIYGEYDDILKTSQSYQVLIGNQFFLPTTRSVNHYLFADAGLAYYIWDIDAAPQFKDNLKATTMIGFCGYGLEYLVNRHISFWGRLNLVAANYLLNEIEEESNLTTGEYTKLKSEKALKFLSIQHSAIGITFYLN